MSKLGQNWVKIGSASGGLSGPGELGRIQRSDSWGGKERSGADWSRMALPLISFDYKPCPGACVWKLSDWITVNGLNWLVWSGWIVMVQHARPAEGRRIFGSFRLLTLPIVHVHSVACDLSSKFQWRLVESKCQMTSSAQWRKSILFQAIRCQTSCLRPWQTKTG